MADERIGTVTHYFAEPEVGVIALDAELAVGDRVRFSGSTTDFEQGIRSMEVEHESVERGEPGQEIAVKVEQRVREGDEVFRA